MTDTAASRVIDLGELIESRRSQGFVIKLLILSCLVTFFDGLDLMMVAFTAPYMQDELGLSNSMLGEIFAAGVAGQVIGSFCVSYLADRYGRRPIIVWSTFAFGILTAATALATSYPQLLVMRLLDGIAIGGALPSAWALNIEYAPRHRRSTIITVIMFGFSLGSTVAGPLTNVLAPTHGWEGVFLAGGLGTLVIAVAMLLWLPESLRFLVASRQPMEKVVATARHFGASEADITVHDRVIMSDEVDQPKNRHFHVRDLFRGDLLLLTPLIWLGYFVSSLAIMFNGSWGPLLLEYLDVGRKTAALVMAFGGVLGALAGIILLSSTEKRGVGWIMLYPALAVPSLLLLGLDMLPALLFLPFIILAGIFIGGAHVAVISITSIYYPSAIRANGGGWAASVAKSGGVVGPLIGGALLSTDIPVLSVFALLAICPAIMLVCIGGIALVVSRRPPEQA